jgi:hypothetical protein
VTRISEYRAEFASLQALLGLERFDRRELNRVLAQHGWDPSRPTPWVCSAARNSGHTTGCGLNPNVGVKARRSACWPFFG